MTDMHVYGLGGMQEIAPHLPELVPYLFTNLNDPKVRIYQFKHDEETRLLISLFISLLFDPLLVGLWVVTHRGFNTASTFYSH